MRKQINRKKSWDGQGVSEVIGTILTLGITVILFSGILMTINQFPAPGENVFTSFSANVEPYDDWNLGANITITNTGGTVLLDLPTRVILSVDTFTYSLDTKGFLGVEPYGLTGDAIWDTGETWRIYLNNTQISKDSDLGVMIIDIDKNVVVWSADITGKDNQFGPIVHNIWVDSNLDTIRKDPIDFGREFYVFASVTDPDNDLDVTSVYADLSSINSDWDNIRLTLDTNDGYFRSESIEGPIQGTVPIGYHLAIVFAHDLATPQHNSSGVGRVPVGQDIGSQPNLVIRGDDPENHTWGDVEVSVRNPTNGQTISISATVRNFGGHCVANLSFYDEVGGITKFISSQEISPPEGPSQVKSRSIVFLVRGGGLHKIWAEVIPVDVVDFDPNDNSNYTLINVMPTILLVDDDAHNADRSPYDTVSFMRSALEACDFDYDLYRINPGYNGPEYRYGEMRLRNYDVVIWMCGYEFENTLTAADQRNITMYLHDEDGTGSAGSLWLIGQKLLDDVPFSFFEDQIMVSSKLPTFPPPFSGPTNLTGVAGNPVSNEWNATNIPVIERASGENTSYIIEPDTVQGAEITFDHATITPSFANAINYENISTGERVLFFPFEYSRIERPSDQTQVTYKAIMWLGNISQRLGNDLAISEQTTDPYYVFLNQNVNVTAVVRSNGNNTLEKVEAMLFIDDVKDTTTLTTFNISGLGGTVTISTLWKAESLGLHVLKWMVDPNMLVPETNEHNNMVPSYVTTGEVFVKFRILVVDDDGSANNNNGTETGLHDETKYITDSIYRIGYEYEYNGTNSTYVVDADIGKNGPSGDIIKEYSAVIWVTGNAPAGLTAGDDVNLTDYLQNYNGQVWIIGTDIWSGIPGSGLPGIMGIDNIYSNTGITGHLLGMDDSNISHGMDIPMIDCPNADAFEPAAGAEGVFTQNHTDGNYSAVLYGEGDYRSLAFGFNCTTLYGSEAGFISGDNATDEITYLVLHWFGKPETRKEARITMRDVNISDDHPLIGNAYIIRARVHNVGAQSTNLLVRFMDGLTQIGADSISIDPDARTSAEIIWKPLYAGQRTISILVDPIAEVDEIFEWFNNNVSFETYVYFFWDDMESGDSKWSHAATIMNINGESPLDYSSSYIDPSTNISDDWDWTESYGVENTTKTAHSYPTSFYMEEGTGMFGQADVLISFVIDDSASMTSRSDSEGRTWLEAAQAAAKVLLDQLSDDSRCVSVWDFSSQKARRWWGATDAPLPITSEWWGGTQNPDALAPIRLGDAFPPIGDGRDYIGQQIDSMDNPNGQTIIWDSIGGAYEDISYWAPFYPDLIPAVIVLGDGADNQASDGAGFSEQGAEGGSKVWAPWDDMAIGKQDYGQTSGNPKPCHYGKYSHWSDPNANAQWIETGVQGGSVDHDRVGLLYSDIMIFTIGLGLEHHEPPYLPEVTDYPGDLAADPVNAFYNESVNSDGQYRAIDPKIYQESGTIEYNFWRIANTSGAQYFYAPDSDGLEDIFAQIGQFLASGFNQTRSSNPEPETRATSDNFDKRAVTETFNLTDVETAKLSFWHKYNILQGGNGAFLQVAYKTSAGGSWRYRYIIPPGQYTGGLYYPIDIYDDFGNIIKWCWNGLSGNGGFTWDYSAIDVLPYVPEGFNPGDGHYYRSEVRVAFNYTQFGGGTGVGWYLDDVKLVVSRNDNTPIGENTQDVWAMNDTIAHSGTHSWSNVDPITGNIKTGVDNYLITSPIDLTNAKTAYLSTYFKFNLNYAGGRPPDGFRVEITTDGGVIWTPINLGVRSSWGVSGTGDDDEDGNASDGKTITGLTDSYDWQNPGLYNPASDEYWVNASSLSRLNVDLSAWSGNQIRLRFRVVTNNLATSVYAHDNNANYGDPGFGGLYVDDVIISGETIFG